jgi:hypothetical protein
LSALGTASRSAAAAAAACYSASVFELGSTEQEWDNGTIEESGFRAKKPRILRSLKMGRLKRAKLWGEVVAWANRHLLGNHLRVE